MTSVTSRYDLFVIEKVEKGISEKGENIFFSLVVVRNDKVV